eukprot:TRINITY_DN45255_c0_g1_i1.p1 TRINITY_DN45255_c0_g1~~TRINITY_DN45255_c0_g1_i1.p1  ORF type:complete len:239 (-),score=54.89 TRINITY_DN45255_c0_g1_i1:293-958(-)
MSVRTIFVTGFPPDASERELRNMFRLCPGYEGAVVDIPPATGRIKNFFVKFVSNNFARRVLDDLQGMCFDEFVGQYPVKAEFAKRDAEIDPGGQVMHSAEEDRRKRPRVEMSMQRPPSMLGYRYTAPGPRFAQSTAPRFDHSGSGRGSGGIDTLACKIEGTTERDLRAAFQEYHGYIDGKFLQKSHIFFAKFQSPEMAEAALQLAQQDGFDAAIAKRNMEM